MTGALHPAGGRYNWFGWQVGAAPAETASARLTETHEYFHRQLDDTTAFGGLTTTIASLADAQPEERWADIRDRLQNMSDLVHESYAVGLSLLTTQRRLEPIPGYPAYDRHVRTVLRLLGQDVHPWVALAALRAAATACMQSGALAVATAQGVEQFEPISLRALDRPNHRLAALLADDYASRVARAQSEARDRHSEEPWWFPLDGVLLRPEAVDGEAAEAFGTLHLRLFDDAEAILRSANAYSIGPDAHHDDLRVLLRQVRTLAPEGLTRIGALVEAPGGDLLQGGALDSQTIALTAAPERAVLLPYGSISGLSGEGKWRHDFLVVTRAQRIRAAHTLEGVALPETESVACLRSIVYDGEQRDSVLLVSVERPEELEEEAPIFVSVFSSAAAADPSGTATWMLWADPSRVSLVMDTPLTAALRRWCGEDGRFRCQTRLIRVEDMEVRVIAGRVEHDGRHSPLVVVPSTEFGARWFDSVREEDSDLATIVQDDPDFFEEESDHLDVVLNHLLFEERYIGTGELATMSDWAGEKLVTLDLEDAEGLWEAWTEPGEEDILARAAFDRALRAAAGLEDEGLYFRPGGWSVDLPVTAARIAVAAAVLGVGFQIAGLEDLDREIIIAAASFIASMDVRPVRLGRQERRLADRLAGEGMAGTPVTASRARRALPKKQRRKVGRDQVAEALGKLVAAGLADQQGDDEWVLRAQGSEAWLRFSLRHGGD